MMFAIGFTVGVIVWPLAVHVYIMYPIWKARYLLKKHEKEKSQ